MAAPLPPVVLVLPPGGKAGRLDTSLRQVAHPALRCLAAREGLPLAEPFLRVPGAYREDLAHPSEEGAAAVAAAVARCLLANWRVAPSNRKRTPILATTPSAAPNRSVGSMAAMKKASAMKAAMKAALKAMKAKPVKAAMKAMKAKAMRAKAMKKRSMKKRAAPTEE